MATARAISWGGSAGLHVAAFAALLLALPARLPPPMPVILLEMPAPLAPPEPIAPPEAEVVPAAPPMAAAAPPPPPEAVPEPPKLAEAAPPEPPKAVEPPPPVAVAGIVPPPPPKPKAVPKPRPVVQPRPAPATPRTETARAEPTPEPRVAAPAAPAAPARPVATSNTPSSSYIGALMRALERHKAYPQDARWRGAQGVALLRFRMRRDGSVVGFRIERSAGDPALDEAVTTMIRRASPLPAPPPDFGGELIELTVPVRFFLQ